MKKATSTLFPGYCVPASGAASAKNQSAYVNIPLVQTRVADKKTECNEIVKQPEEQCGSGTPGQFLIDRVVAEQPRLLQIIRSCCACCVVLYEQATMDRHIPQAKIDALPAWQGGQRFTPAKQAALYYTEILSDVVQQHIRQAHETIQDSTQLWRTIHTMPAPYAGTVVTIRR